MAARISDPDEGADTSSTATTNTTDHTADPVASRTGHQTHSDVPESDVRLDRLIDTVDLDGLIQLIDARLLDQDWAGMLRIRDRCRAATRETGRQLWPAATLAEYRLALEAPARWAVTVLDDESGRFTIGPLSEVIAVRHTWAELTDLLAPSATALYTAHERGLRGEPIDPTTLADLPPVIELSPNPYPWEPSYALASYGLETSEFPSPDVVAVGPPIDADLTSRVAVVIADDDTDTAVRQLFERWTGDSTGRVEMACVEGDHLDAIAALGVTRARVTPISMADGLALLAWAGASGAAHGRRRGTAAGRDSAWWLLATLGDLVDEWPPAPADMAALIETLHCYQWNAFEPTSGWRVQLAIADDESHLAWVINARDDAD